MATGGELTFSRRVLSEIAFRSAMEVPGVRGTSGDLMSGLIGRLKRGSAHRGINVSEDSRGLVFRIDLVIAQGGSIVDLGTEVQAKVGSQIKLMTGRDAVVNVKVTAIE